MVALFKAQASQSGFFDAYHVPMGDVKDTSLLKQRTLAKAQKLVSTSTGIFRGSKRPLASPVAADPFETARIWEESGCLSDGHRPRFLLASHYVHLPKKQLATALNLPSEDSLIMIDVVREPVDRYHSHWTYLINPNARPTKEAAEREMQKRNSHRCGCGNGTTFDECILAASRDGCPQNAQLPPMLVEWMCGQAEDCIDPLSSKALQRAIENVKNEYLFVGLTEHIWITMQALEKLAPRFMQGSTKLMGSDIPMEKSQKGTQKSLSVSQEARALLEQNTPSELIMYREVVRIFWEKVHCLGIDASSEVLNEYDMQALSELREIGRIPVDWP